MDENRCIEILKIERECVKRNLCGMCDNRRDCIKCNLLLSANEIIDAYDYAIHHISVHI